MKSESCFAYQNIYRCSRNLDIFFFILGQIPAIFFPPNFVRHEFRRIGPEVDPVCPPLRCAPVPEGCAQPRIIMVNGRRCPFCPRNICTDLEPPREGLEGNRILLSIAETNSQRESNNSPPTSTRDTEQRTDRPASPRSTPNGRSSPDPDSPFFAPNERRVVRTGRQGVRGTRIDPPTRRRTRVDPPARQRSGSSRNRSPSTGSRARTGERSRSTEPSEKPPSKIQPVENQQNAHILFPLEPFRENVISDTEPKSNKNEKSQKSVPVKPPVTPAPTTSTPAPTHGTRSGRQARQNIHLLFQALNRIGSQSRNQQPNNNQPNRPPQTPFLPPLHAMAGSPFTQVVQQGSQNNNRQNGDTQSSNRQRQAINGIHPLLPMFLLQQARLNSLNAPTPSPAPNAPNAAAQNTPQRNNAPNLQHLPPHLRAMMPFPFFNPAANQQNTIPGMTMQANQAGPANGEPSVPPVTPTVQAEINQWMDQMAMPIQEVLGEVSPSQSGSRQQPNLNQIQRNQLTPPAQQVLNIGQQQNPQTQQPRIPNQAFFQQWLQQMALQRQRLAAGQAPGQMTPQGAPSNRATPQTPNSNLLFQNMDPSRMNTAAQNPVNPAASTQNNAAGSNGGFTQWLDSLATQIQHQLEDGSNPVPQTNAIPQQLINNMPQHLNVLQNFNNVPSPNGVGGEVNFNNWLENMVSPIQQELTRSPGNPQGSPARGGADIPASAWINEMVDPIQQGLGRR